MQLQKIKSTFYHPIEYDLKFSQLYLKKLEINYLQLEKYYYIILRKMSTIGETNKATVQNYGDDLLKVQLEADDSIAYEDNGQQVQERLVTESDLKQVGGPLVNGQSDYQQHNTTPKMKENLDKRRMDLNIKQAISASKLDGGLDSERTPAERVKENTLGHSIYKGNSSLISKAASSVYQQSQLNIQNIEFQAVDVTEDTEQTGSMNKTIDDQTQIQIISSNDLTDLLNARQQIINETPPQPVSLITTAQNSFSNPMMSESNISKYQMDPFKFVSFPGGLQQAVQETVNPNYRQPRVIYKHANNFIQLPKQSFPAIKNNEFNPSLIVKGNGKNQVDQFHSKQYERPIAKARKTQRQSIQEEDSQVDSIMQEQILVNELKLVDITIPIEEAVNCVNTLKYAAIKEMTECIQSSEGRHGGLSVENAASSLKKLHTGELTDEEVPAQFAGNTRNSRGGSNLSRLDADNASSNSNHNDMNRTSSPSGNSGFGKSECRGSVVPQEINRSYNITEIMDSNLPEESATKVLLKIVPIDDVEPTIKVVNDSQKQFSPQKQSRQEGRSPKEKDSKQDRSSMSPSRGGNQSQLSYQSNFQKTNMLLSTMKHGSPIMSRYHAQKKESRGVKILNQDLNDQLDLNVDSYNVMPQNAEGQSGISSSRKQARAIAAKTLQKLQPAKPQTKRGKVGLGSPFKQRMTNRMRKSTSPIGSYENNSLGHKSRRSKKSSISDELLNSTRNSFEPKQELINHLGVIGTQAKQYHQKTKRESLEAPVLQDGLIQMARVKPVQSQSKTFRNEPTSRCRSPEANMIIDGSYLDRSRSRGDSSRQVHEDKNRSNLMMDRSSLISSNNHSIEELIKQEYFTNYNQNYNYSHSRINRQIMKNLRQQQKMRFQKRNQRHAQSVQETSKLSKSETIAQTILEIIRSLKNKGVVDQSKAEVDERTTSLGTKSKKMAIIGKNEKEKLKNKLAQVKLLTESQKDLITEINDQLHGRNNAKVIILKTENASEATKSKVSHLSQSPDQDRNIQITQSNFMPSQLNIPIAEVRTPGAPRSLSSARQQVDDFKVQTHRARMSSIKGGVRGTNQRNLKSEESRNREVASIDEQQNGIGVPKEHQLVGGPMTFVKSAKSDPESLVRSLMSNQSPRVPTKSIVSPKWNVDVRTKQCQILEIDQHPTEPASPDRARIFESQQIEEERVSLKHIIAKSRGKTSHCQKHSQLDDPPVSQPATSQLSNQSSSPLKGQRFQGGIISGLGQPKFSILGSLPFEARDQNEIKSQLSMLSHHKMKAVGGQYSKRHSQITQGIHKIHEHVDFRKTQNMDRLMKSTGMGAQTRLIDRSSPQNSSEIFSGKSGSIMEIQKRYMDNKSEIERKLKEQSFQHTKVQTSVLEISQDLSPLNLEKKQSKQSEHQVVYQKMGNKTDIKLSRLLPPLNVVERMDQERDQSFRAIDNRLMKMRIDNQQQTTPHLASNVKLQAQQLKNTMRMAATKKKQKSEVPSAARKWLQESTQEMQKEISLLQQAQGIKSPIQERDSSVAETSGPARNVTFMSFENRRSETDFKAFTNLNFEEAKNVDLVSGTNSPTSAAVEQPNKQDANLHLTQELKQQQKVEPIYKPPPHINIAEIRASQLKQRLLNLNYQPKSEQRLESSRFQEGIRKIKNSIYNNESGLSFSGQLEALYQFRNRSVKHQKNLRATTQEQPVENKTHRSHTQNFKNVHNKSPRKRAQIENMVNYNFGEMTKMSERMIDYGDNMSRQEKCEKRQMQIIAPNSQDTNQQIKTYKRLQKLINCQQMTQNAAKSGTQSRTGANEMNINTSSSVMSAQDYKESVEKIRQHSESLGSMEFQKIQRNMHNKTQIQFESFSNQPLNRNNFRERGSANSSQMQILNLKHLHESSKLRHSRNELPKNGGSAFSKRASPRNSHRSKEISHSSALSSHFTTQGGQTKLEDQKRGVPYLLPLASQENFIKTHKEILTKLTQEEKIQYLLSNN